MQWASLSCALPLFDKKQLQIQQIAMWQFQSAILFEVFRKLRFSRPDAATTALQATKYERNHAVQLVAASGTAKSRLGWFFALALGYLQSAGPK